MSDRIPPNSLESEMATIGAAIVSREALDVALDIVTPRDFYSVGHEAIWETIRELGSAGKPVDKISVAERLRDRGKLEHVGGLAYLSSLSAESIGDASSAEYFARIVREKAMLRNLIAAGQKISSLGFDGEIDVDAAIAEAEMAFSKAVDRGHVSSGTLVFEDMRDNYLRVLQLTADPGETRGILTPFQSLNDKIGPVMPGEMVLIPAGTTMGKTALLLQIADYVAAHYGAVLIASAEIEKAEVAMRYGALYGRVSVRKQRIGTLTDEEIMRVAHATEVMRDRPIYLHDIRSICRLSDLRRELRLLSRTTLVRAVIVDGINFFEDVDAKSDRSTKNDRMDAVYRSLIKIFKEFGVGGYVAQHVNREGYGGVPTLKSIRDGGNAEGHAHAIVTPYRPNPTGTYQERLEGKFVVLKARAGDAGTIDNMEFHGARSMWLDPSSSRPWFEAAPEAVEEREPELAY